MWEVESRRLEGGSRKIASNRNKSNSNLDVDGIEPVNTCRNSDHSSKVLHFAESQANRRGPMRPPVSNGSHPEASSSPMS